MSVKFTEGKSTTDRFKPSSKLANNTDDKESAFCLIVVQKEQMTLQSGTEAYKQ